MNLGACYSCNQILTGMLHVDQPAGCWGLGDQVLVTLYFIATATLRSAVLLDVGPCYCC